jgi:hypothetical protein
MIDPDGPDTRPRTTSTKKWRAVLYVPRPRCKKGCINRHACMLDDNHQERGQTHCICGVKGCKCIDLP